MKYLILTIALGTIVFFGFKKASVIQNATSAETEATTITLDDSSESFSVDLSQDLSYNLTIPSTSKNDVIDYYETIFGGTIDSIFEWEALYNSGKDTITLIVTAWANHAFRPLATEWTEGETTWLLDGVEHWCTGAPCGCCEFIKIDGKVKGCGCMSIVYRWCTGDQCNHTIHLVEDGG